MQSCSSAYSKSLGKCSVTEESSSSDDSLDSIAFTCHRIAEEDESIASYPSSESCLSETERFLRDSLENNWLFACQSDEQRLGLIPAFEWATFSRNQVILNQGQLENNYFYVLQQGSILVEQNKKTVGIIDTPGCSFGELSILYCCPQSATVKANSHETKLFRVKQSIFAACLDLDNQRATHKKVLYLKQYTKNWSDDARLLEIAQHMTVTLFPPGPVQPRPGETWFLHQGAVQDKDGSNILKGDGFQDEVVSSSAGIAFVTTAFDLKNDGSGKRNPSSASNAAMENDASAETNPSSESDAHPLANIKYFSSATDDQLAAITKRSTKKSFRANATVFRSGTKVKPAIYVIKKGLVQVDCGTDELATLRAGDVFGHELLDQRDAAKIFLTAPYTTTTLEPCECDVLSYRELRTIYTPYESSESIEPDKFPDTVDRLKRHKILGEGSFGQVWLVTNKDSAGSQAYALKILNKHQLIEAGEVGPTLNEKAALMKLDHPFVSKLYKTYQDRDCLYEVFDFIQGGELFSMLHPNAQGFHSIPDDRAKFYTFCLADALIYMHDQKCIHRDMKPENVLVGRNGYPKIIDFGFSKILQDDKTYTFCGTPGYLAPEIINHEAHDRGVDFWALGILVTEILTGYNPFKGPTEDNKTYKSNVTNGVEIKLRKKVDPKAESLIQGLLQRDPNERTNGAGVIGSSWLVDLDQDGICQCIAKAPFIPNVQSALDTSCFDDWSDQTDKSRLQFPKLSLRDQQRFEGF